MKLVLLRHGQTDWNAGHRYQGRTDIPLNQMGEEQAVEASGRWNVADFDVAVASPLIRARRTAELVLGSAQSPLKTHPGLVEADGGAWESLTFEQIKTQWPEAYTSWRGSNMDVGPVGGETPRQAGKRVSESILGVLGEAEPETLLVVGHGSALRAGAATLAGVEDSGFGLIERMENCRALVLTSTDGVMGSWRIEVQNA